ncbi:MAG: hypothetical protein PHU40_10900 [Sulfurimonas sp.]|nr:hypothetical protein [Sulfurimonas sp.]
MKTISWKLSALASALLLAGCGGSSTSDTASVAISSPSIITGTVPGTLIEAFCTDGSYYKVKSTLNGTSEHPFEIELPSTVDCSLVMTTNEDDNATRVITQIGIVTPTASGTLFRAAADINLGYIPLAMDPTSVDFNGDHVSDVILNIDVNGTSLVIALDNPLDDDDDGLINVYEDDDDDNISNYYDDDDDDNGILDIYENDNDSDGDGIDDDDDVDDDNDGDHDDDDSSSTTTTILLPTNYTANAGRLLGSQCAQCHGTNGISTNDWDSIAGEDEFVSEDFSDEAIMHAQALGYTDAEKILIDEWLRTLSSND